MSKLTANSIAAMFLSLALILPYLTGQSPQLNSMLCPMHIPVLLCGFICGSSYGTIIGFIAPLLRSCLLGMPVMFPNAICMAFELATYGFISGHLYNKYSQKKSNIYISLIVAKIIGRIIWGIMMFICMGFIVTKFNFRIFISSGLIVTIPGTILQLIIIPVVVSSIRKKVSHYIF